MVICNQAGFTSAESENLSFSGSAVWDDNLDSAVIAAGFDVSDEAITISEKTRLRAALAVAIAADLLQIAVFPLFIEGAASPADDILDLAVAGVLGALLGWHWEFLPSFVAKLVPGVDFIPLWTMAVANVYRKRGKIQTDTEGPEGRVIEGEPVKRNASGR